MLDVLPVQSRILPMVLLFCWVMIASCGGDLPPAPGHPADSVNYAPLGMPDWTQSQYDWIDRWDSSCREYTFMRDWWTPKFSLIVMGISPDGGTLLLRRGRGLLLYDTASRSVQTVLTGEYEHASWSHNGRYIAAVKNTQVFIVDLEGNGIYALPVGDTLGWIGPAAQWLPNDSAVIIVGSGSGSTSGGHFSVDINYPYHIKRYPVLRASGYWFAHDRAYYLASEPAGSRNRTVLKVGRPGDSLDLADYPLDGVAGFDAGHLSPNGDWLAFRMDADLRGSHFHDFLDVTDKITSLGIIDLRENSPTQYKLYRVFPDYTHFFRVCANLFSFSEGVVSPDGRYVYHERARLSDSTVQVVRRDIATGVAVEISNFLTPP